MCKQYIVAGIGELLWDMFPGGKALGGAPANFAYHASQFGLRGYAVSAVGGDPLGMEILGTLAEKQLRYMVDTVDYPTGTVQVTVDSNGVPQYEICRDVAWDNIPFTERTEQLARTCRAVCFGTLAQRSEVSRTAIRRFLEIVPGDCLKVFDINLRQNYYDRELIHDSLSQCNILKINDEEVSIVGELFDMGRLSDAEVCKRLLRDYGLELVVETMGTKGSRILTGKEESFIATPRVEVVDTVGAGDAFTGAFIASLLNGAPLREAHQVAVNIAAFVCTREGAMPEVPAGLTSI